MFRRCWPYWKSESFGSLWRNLLYIVSGRCWLTDSDCESLGRGLTPGAQSGDHFLVLPPGDGNLHVPSSPYFQIPHIPKATIPEKHAQKRAMCKYCMAHLVRCLSWVCSECSFPRFVSVMCLHTCLSVASTGPPKPGWIVPVSSTRSLTI